MSRKVAFLLLLPLGLSACAPTALTVMSLATGGFSYATTGKGVSDHALSQITQSDCAVHRALFQGEPVCESPQADVALADDMIGPPPPETTIVVATGR